MTHYNKMPTREEQKSLIQQFITDPTLAHLNMCINHLIDHAPIQYLITSEGMERVMPEYIQQKLNHLETIWQEYIERNYPTLIKTDENYKTFL